MSPQQIQELELRYRQMKEKVKKYFIAQSEYFKSEGADRKRKLIILKNYEKEIKEMIDPKPKQQQELYNWLGQ